VVLLASFLEGLADEGRLDDYRPALIVVKATASPSTALPEGALMQSGIF